MKTWDQITARRRAQPGYAERIAAEKREALGGIHAFNLAELRRIADFTQQELARRMGSDQSRVSRVEHGEDMHLSTLRAYVNALGGELHIYAEIPGQDPLPLAI
jgi:ribosome-binding protein aMBF1 (putative translation factor)